MVRLQGRHGKPRATGCDSTASCTASESDKSGVSFSLSLCSAGPFDKAAGVHKSENAALPTTCGATAPPIRMALARSESVSAMCKQYPRRC